MADGMFGTPIGTRAFEDDARKAVTFGLDAQHRLGQIAMQPVEMEFKRAQTDELKAKVEEQKGMQELMRRVMGGGAEVPGQEGGEQPDLATVFDRAAKAAAGSGYVTKAADLAKSAAELRTKGATAENQQVQARLRQIQTVKEQAQLTAQMFGGATDEASWRLANDLYTFQTGKPSPFAGVEYNPQFVESLNRNALEAKERADLEERRLTRQGTEKNRDRLSAQFHLEQSVREANLEINRQREERLKKNAGAKSAGRLPSAEPKPAEIAQVKSLLQRDYSFLSNTRDSESLRALSEAAFTIAAEARAKMRAHPALSPSAAINLAYTEAQKAGDFETGAAFSTPLGDFGKKLRFAGGGRSPETALPVPQKPAERKANRHYILPNGSIGIWRGNGWELVDMSSRLSGDNARRNPQEEE